MHRHRKQFHLGGSNVIYNAIAVIYAAWMYIDKVSRVKYWGDPGPSCPPRFLRLCNVSQCLRYSDVKCSQDTYSTCTCTSDMSHADSVNTSSYIQSLKQPYTALPRAYNYSKKDIRNCKKKSWLHYVGAARALNLVIKKQWLHNAWLGWTVEICSCRATVSMQLPKQE